VEFVHRSSVISPVLLDHGIVLLAMTHFPQPHSTRRAPRVQLGGAVPAAVVLDDGKRAKAQLQTISVTGGMLQMTRALERGDFVEIAFQTKSGAVSGMAEMLSVARAAENGCLQPFRFIAIGDEDHRNLRMALDSVLDRGFAGMQSNSFLSSKGF
jgi:hypothetical protein